VRQRRIFGTLVTAQFAFAIVLLTSGGLLIRSVGRLLDTDPGVRRDHVITLSTSLPATTYSKGSDVRAFYQRLLARVGQIPGVSEVATATDVPLSVRERRAFTVETPNEAAAGLPHVIAHDWVNGKYFDALGIRLISGRFLTEQDGTGPDLVVVLNETMARRFWPGVDPVGRRMAWGGARLHGPWMRIVGVVADVRQAGLSVPPEPQTWTPWMQLPDTALAENPTGIFKNLTIILRTSVPPESVIASVRQEVRAIDPLLPLSNVKTLDDVLRESTASERFNASLLGAFAATALLLAAIGVAGVLAISVSRRTAEIGIRLALGARSSDVLVMVLRQGLTLVLLGLAIGLPSAFFVTRLLSTLLFGVGPHDPIAFAGATVLLLAVALAACVAPAIRASRIEPIAALRID
jgi:predicted permease